MHAQSRAHHFGRLSSPVVCSLLLRKARMSSVCFGLVAVARHDGHHLPLGFVQVVDVPETDLEQLALQPRQMVLLQSQAERCRVD